MLRCFRTDGPLMELVSSEPLHFQILRLQSTSSPSPAGRHVVTVIEQVCCLRVSGHGTAAHPAEFHSSCWSVVDLSCTLVPGLSPVSCGGLMWVLWCSRLCSVRSLVYRKCRRHLSQLNTFFFYRDTNRASRVMNVVCWFQ